MKSKYSIFQLLILLLLISSAYKVDAQSCDFNKNTIETNSLCSLQTVLTTEDAILKARDAIIFKPGFKVGPTELYGHKFTATVNNGYTGQPVTYQTTQTLPPLEGLDKSGCIPGTIGETIDVSPTGAATYTLPIQVSPGSNGVQPNIGIVYSSQSGNGLLGWGWSISGLSSITRTNQVGYYDGNYQEFLYDASDKFALDGARLILNNDGFYYPLNNPYTKISFTNNTFTVTTQDGAKMQYGGNENSRIKTYQGTVAYAWALSRYTDPNGNYIDYEYYVDELTGEYRVSEIKYTGNSINGKLPYNSIKFYYDIRDDINTNYIRGGKVNQSSLLTSIKVYCEGAVSKVYEFSYFKDIYSKLNKISFTADGIKYNPTYIIWGISSYSTMLEDAQLGSYHDYQLYPGDYNGDGRVDIAKWNRNNYFIVNVALAGGGYTTKTFSTPSNSTTYTPTSIITHTYTIQDVKILDRNNDGNDDILVHYIYHRREQSNSGVRDEDYFLYETDRDVVTRYYYNETTIASLIQSDFISGSTEGDGDPSLYGTYNYFYADLNNDGNVEKLTVKNNILVSCENITLPTFSISNISEMQFLDYDGDGRMEFLTLSSTGYGAIYEYDGSTFVLKYGTPTTTLFGKSKNIFFGDFNGDGKTDYLSYHSGAWHLYYSTGLEFVEGTIPTNLVMLEPANSGKIHSGTTFTPASTICIDDLNSDGKSDIIQAVDGTIVNLTINTFISTGNSFVFYETYEYPIINNIASNYIQVLDLDSDGQKELIYGNDQYNSSGVPIINPFAKHAFWLGTSENMYVNVITDGLDNRVSFLYFSYKDNRQYSTSFPKPAFPLMLVRGPMKMVSKVLKRSVGNVADTSSYTYQDGYLHLQGMGFLGFKSFTVKNSSTQVESTSTSEYEIPGVAGVYSPWINTVIVKKNNTNISSQTNSMGILGGDISQKFFMPVLSGSIASDYLNCVTTETSNTYNSTNGRLETTISESGNWTVTSTTSWSSGTESNISKLVSATITKSNGTGNPYTVTTSLTYDNAPYSMRIKSKSEQGITTTFSDFDSYSNAKTVNVTAGGLSRTTNCTYDDKGRFILTTTDELGNVSKASYRYSDGAKLWDEDPLGNRTTYSFSFSNGQLTTTAYLPDGNVKTTYVGWDNSITNSLYKMVISITNGNTSTTYFNAAGQKLKETSLGYKGITQSIDYTYNFDGSVYTETTSGISTPTTYSYLNDGRLSSVIGHNTNITYGYSCNLGTYSMTTTDNISSTNHTKNFDALGNVMSVSGTSGAISYTYLSSGKVESIVAAGSTTSMTYDERGNQLTLSDPDAGLTTYTYNELNQLISQTDNLNQQVTLAYDEDGLLLSKIGAGINETYTYLQTPGKFGMLASVTRDGITESYVYDGLGRVISTTTTGAGKSFTTTKQYNTKGQLEHITYPTNLTIELGYDLVGNLEKIYDDANKTVPIWTGNDKNEREQWTRFTLGNGLITKYEYDQNYRLNRIKTGTSTNEISIQNLTFLFNSIGQLDYREDNALHEEFDYDALNRLIASTVTGQSTVNYVYETNGNISSTSLAGTYAYGGGLPHAVTSVVGPAGYTNQSPSIFTSSSYTGDNRIAEMNNGTYKNVFAYGPSGNRFKVDHYQTNNLVSSKIYVGNSEFVLDNGGNITTSRTFIFSPTGICAVFEKVGAAAGVFHYIHTDYLDSWLAITSNAGAIENRYSYDAWGRPRDPSTWQLLPISITNALGNLIAMQPRFDRGYTGHEHMCGFGLINMNGRLYDPYLQRFLSPDNYVQSPFNPQSYNRYTYCMNNPLMYTDPSGFTWWSHFRGWVKENWKTIAAVTVATVAIIVTQAYIPAIIGAYINLGVNLKNVENFGDMIGYLAVGAAAGAIGTGIGSGINSALVKGVGGTFIRGFTGVATKFSTGFWSGLVTGAGGGFAGGFVSGFGNESMQGGDLGDILKAGWNYGWKGAIIGGVGGGIGGYIDATNHDLNPWTGASKQNMTIQIKNNNVYLTDENDIMSGVDYSTKIENGNYISINQEGQVTIRLPNEMDSFSGPFTEIYNPKIGSSIIEMPTLSKDFIKFTAIDHSKVIINGWRWYSHGSPWYKNLFYSR